MPSHKRKRSASITSHSPQPAPPNTINPHSHTEGTIKQLRTAGLSDADLLPSSYTPAFPHRPLQPTTTTTTTTTHHLRDPAADNDDDDDDAPAKARRAAQMRDAQDAHLGLLTQMMLRALSAGDVARAARAFGLLRRSSVRGRGADLRRDGLWSLGAEVLMRQGEEEAGRRWGSAGSMARVRAYLEGLIRQYPYNRLHPTSVSDLDFYPVLFGCEVYSAWAEQRLALERLEREADAWSDDDLDVLLDPDDDEGAYDADADRVPLSGRERRLRREKADLALRAGTAMRDVAKRMDALLENAPYNRSVEMLRLRGMVALYVGDLSMPPPPRTEEEEEEGRRIRGQERDRARTLFAKMIQNGGRPDAFTDKWLSKAEDDDHAGDEDDDDMSSAWSGLPVFSSLPMR